MKIFKNISYMEKNPLYAVSSDPIRSVNKDYQAFKHRKQVKNVDKINIYMTWNQYINYPFQRLYFPYSDA